MSDIKERNNTCSHPDCNHDKFKNSEECILHCEKDDWFVIDKKGNKDWRKSEDKIKEFWRVIYDLWGRGKSIKNVFFPPIDDSDKLSNNKGSDLRTKKGILFEFDNFLKISNSTFLGDFRLNYKFKFEGILFDEETKFLGDLEINNVTIGIKLQFINVTFSKRCSFIMLNDIMLEFFNTTFKEILNFQNLINLKKLEIANSPNIKKISIRECNINSVNICKNKVFNEIEIVQTTINDQLNLSNRRVDVFSFKDCNFNNITITGILAKQVYFEKCNFEDDFSIENFRLICSIFFKSLSFSKKSDVYINNNKISNFKIANLMNDSKYFTISNCKTCNSLEYIEGNYSNLEFHNCSFEKSKIFIKNIAFISNTGFTIFNDVKWSEYDSFVKKSTPNNDGKDYNINSNRDTFRQLKIVNEKQGNIIEANKFYSAEMDEYRKELIGKESKASAKDKFVFGISYLISNFSRDWILPLIWYFVFGFIFSFIYYLDFAETNLIGIISSVLLILSIIFFRYDFRKLKNFRKTLYILFLTSCLNYFANIAKASLTQYFEFINPFNTSGLDDKDDRLVWWILFRIISVFIIYQFIISLRRQTRR